MLQPIIFVLWPDGKVVWSEDQIDGGAHELIEAPENAVSNHQGATGRLGRHRLDVLRQTPADYLYYRFVWSETRMQLRDIVPVESTRSQGGPVKVKGQLFWNDMPDKQK